MAAKHRTKPGDDDQVTIPAVAYVRCSTDDQIEASIPAQRAAIEQWAAENNYRILRFYADEGISGWKEERAGFQSLMSDLDRRGDFRAVICWHTNRFSRFPVLEANHYWYLLDKAGVHLATVVQGRQDWQDIGSWLKASIEQHGDAQHRHKLSADVRRGKRAVAERGDWAGIPPFGYVVGINRRLELGNPLEIQLVQRLFREYLEGRSLRSICHRLNDEGLAALNNGRGWVPNGIRDKLTNPAYIGIFRWGDVERHDHHPVIIPVADFEQVQRSLNERQRLTTPVLDAGGFLFTRLIRCGKCGAPMSGSNPKLHYYKCRGAMDRGACKCEGNTVKQRELVGYVVDTIEQHWMNPKTVARLRTALHDLVDAEIPKTDAKQMERQIGTIAAKLDKAKRRLIEVPTDMIAVVADQIRELRTQQEQMEAALRAASKPRGALYLDADERIDAAVSRFTQLRQVIARADEIQQREVIRQTVQKIDVWSTPIPNGNKVRFELDRGEIVLRADNLLTPSGCSEQLIRLPFVARKAG